MHDFVNVVLFDPFVSDLFPSSDTFQYIPRLEKQTGAKTQREKSILNINITVHLNVWNISITFVPEKLAKFIIVICQKKNAYKYLLDNTDMHWWYVFK